MTRGDKQANSSGIASIATQKDLDRPERDQLRAFEAIKKLRTAANRIEQLNGPESWDRPIARQSLNACLDLCREILDQKERIGNIVVETPNVISIVLDELIAHLNDLDFGRSDKRMRPKAGGSSRTHDSNDVEFKNFALISVELLSQKHKEAGMSGFRARARQEVADAYSSLGILFRDRPITPKLLLSWAKRRNDRR